MGKDILNLAKKIKGEIKKGVDDYHTGLVGEQIIVASYQIMPIEKLEKMRFIINKIIKKKKIAQKVMQRQKQEKENNQEVHNDDTSNNWNAG